MKIFYMAGFAVIIWLLAIGNYYDKPGKHLPGWLFILIVLIASFIILLPVFIKKK